ncbi:MAG: tRNA (guanosine(37)-N1)-methyltransferase TrmD, partial [Candidatus Moraniibacteriota bacterium]
MHFDILSIFPEAFESYFQASILKRAQDAGHISIRTHDVRAFTTDKHGKVDDTPYGGGAGMVMA